MPDNSRAYPPYGQGDEDSNEAAQYKNDIDAWPSDVPSFELWCAMTLYDPSKENGGTPFQKLMHLLLVQSMMKQEFSHIRDVTEYSDEAGTEFQVSETPRAKYEYKTYQGRNAGVKGMVHSTNRVQLDDAPGLNMGILSGPKTNKGFTSSDVTAYTVTVPRQVLSKSNWAYNHGVYHQDADMVTHGNYAGSDSKEETPGFVEGMGCWENEGCLAFLNQTAAYYGMYYYEGCRDPERNWEVVHEEAGEKFVVRMRSWNPNYIHIDGSGVTVFEEANKWCGKDYVGGETGATVRQRTTELCTAELLGGERKEKLDDHAVRAYIAPFFGLEDGTTEPKPQNSNSIELSNLLHSELCGGSTEQNKCFVFKPTESENNLVRYFGFGVARAHWLYPHSYAPGQAKLKTANVTDAFVKYGRYQPWPHWSSQASQNLDMKASDGGWPLKWTDVFTFGDPAAWQASYTSDRQRTAAYAVKRRIALFGMQDVPMQQPQVQQQPLVAQAAPDRPPTPEADPVPEPDGGVVTDETPDGDPNQQQDVEVITGDGDDVDGAAAARDTFYQELAAVEDWSINARSVEIMQDEEGAVGATEAALPRHLLPFTHSDLYTAATVKLVRTRMQDADVQSYTEKYGSAHNLYLRGQTVASTVEFEPSYGLPKDGVMEQLITAFPAAVCKILYIYYADTKLGPAHTADHKRNGFRNGIWLLNNKVVYPTTKTCKYGTRLWGPVFKNLDILKNRQDIQSDFTDAALMSTHASVKRICEKHKATLSKLTTDMKVKDWITTPYHYAYLPKEPGHLLFRDGETYSAGCLRCSRIFHEYEHMYLAYKHSAPGTYSWPARLWVTDPKKAPQPFHDRLITKHPGELPVQCDTNREIPSATEPGRGWHGWETVAMVVPDAHKSKYKTFKHQNETYRFDYCKFTFRKYDNYAYRAELSQHYKEGILQGRIPGNNARLKYGMADYKLQRASKYGNHCSDCAAVLESAGLFVRNNKVKLQTGMIRANNKLRTQPHTWWVNLLKKMLRDADDDTEEDFRQFDAGTFHAGRAKLSALSPEDRDEALQRFEANMEIARQYLKQVHVDTMGSLTKLRNTPSIHVQPRAFTARNDKSADQLVEEALVSLDALRDGTPRGQQNTIFAKAVEYIKGMYGSTEDALLKDVIAYAQQKVQGGSVTEAGKQRLEHMLQDMARHIYRSHKFKHDGVKKFDSDMARIEERNVTRSIDGKTYNNCLVVTTWQPEGVQQEKSIRKYVTRNGSLVVSPDWPQVANGKATVVVGMKKVIGGADTQHKVVVDVPSENGLSAEEKKLYGLKVKFTPTDSMQYEEKVYYATRTNDNCSNPPKHLTMWCGDDYVIWKKGKGKAAPVQERRMRQSRLFVTYSLHRPVTDEMEARRLMERMADATHRLFGDDAMLSRLLVFGHKIKADQKDSLGTAKFEAILSSEAERKGTGGPFYGDLNDKRSSYLYDTYETHVDSIDVDGGIEIGPNRKHPHFHILITINHFSYVQLDYYKMNHYLEQMFRGVDPEGHGWGNTLRLQDSSGGDFYTDAEQPYVDIRVYPQDNWNDVIAAYVRKNSSPGIFEAIGTRAGA